MKKKTIIATGVILLLFTTLVLAYIFRPMTMNDIYNEPSFNGTVTEVHDKYILVAVDEESDAFKSSDLISVSLATKLKDSMTSFKIGDKIKVFYDGMIAETYPAQVHNVYAIIPIGK